MPNWVGRHLCVLAAMRQHPRGRLSLARRRGDQVVGTLLRFMAGVVIVALLAPTIWIAAAQRTCRSRVVVVLIVTALIASVGPTPTPTVATSDDDSAQHWGVGQAGAGLLFAFMGAEDMAGVDLVMHSVVLADVEDSVDIYTIEGGVEAYDRASEGMAEILVGQTVTLDAETSFGPVAEFRLEDLDDELLGQLRSVAPELVPPTFVVANPEPDERPSIEATTEASVLFEDDFDHENDETGMLDYGGFANWTVESGTVDLLGNEYYDFHPDPGLFLDLDGSRNAGGTLVSREAIALAPGRYRLEFDLAGHPYAGPGTVTVALGELFTGEFSMPHGPDMTGFEHVVRDIEVDRDIEARLSFQQHGGDNIGVLLDKVRLSRLPADAVEEVDEDRTPATAVPEPPTPAPVEATPTPTPTETTRAPTPVQPTPVEHKPIPEPPVQDAARDLWFYEDDTVTRVSHLTGAVLDRWDVSHPDCPAAHGGQPYVQTDGEAAWLTVADAQWETPVLECFIRLPLEGPTELEAYPVPTGRKPTFINAAATQGEDLWALTWKKTPEATLEYYDDWSLARLDRWTGGLTQVFPRVVAMAPTESGLVVLYSKKGAKADARRPLRLGIVEPGRKTPRELEVDAALPRTKPGTYVTPRLRLAAGHEGNVALYDELAGRDVLVFDPASGAIIGRVATPDGATAVGRVWPVSDGVWMSGLLDGGADFVRYAPFDGWTSLDVDSCTDVAGDCYARVEAASDAGVWVSAWPYDAAFEVDLDRVVMRRYDASGQPLAEVAGDEVFGSS